MALKIRLTKLGRKDKPYYRIVVAESRTKRNGRYLEVLGNFDPKIPMIKINKKRFEYWSSKGAKMSEGVKKLKLDEKTT